MFAGYDVILTKEQSVLTKILNSFKKRNMQTEYSVLGYRVNLYSHDYKLAIEIDENYHSNRNIDYEIKRPKEIEQELGIRTDSDKEEIDILKLSIKYLDTSNNHLIN